MFIVKNKNYLSCVMCAVNVAVTVSIYTWKQIQNCHKGDTVRIKRKYKEDKSVFHDQRR